jgi:hypothetical protein
MFQEVIMEKKYERTAEEIARDLDSVTLPGISEEDLEDALGGAAVGIGQILPIIPIIVC